MTTMTVLSLATVQPPHSTRHAVPATVRFRSTEPTQDEVLSPDPQRTNKSAFSPSDLAHLNREFDRYRYGKPLTDMLSPSNRFRVYPHYPYVVLQNFQFVPPTGPRSEQPSSFWGICHELALKLAQRIMNRDVNISHPKDLNIEPVTGQSPRYFNYPSSTHVFLMAFRDKHRAAIERQLNDPGREVPQHTFEDKLDSPKCIVPDHAIIIDPSYGVTQGHADHDGYRIFRLFSMENLIKASKDVRYNVMSFFSQDNDGTPSTGKTPLGYVRTLIGTRQSAAADSPALPPDALIYLGFTTPKRPTQPGPSAKAPPINAELYIQHGPFERPILWKGWQGALPDQSPLKQLMGQIQSDLNRPDPVICEQLNRRFPFEANPVFNLPARLLGWTS